jgi:hypothetical protein
MKYNPEPKPEQLNLLVNAILALEPEELKLLVTAIFAEPEQLKLFVTTIFDLLNKRLDLPPQPIFIPELGRSAAKRILDLPNQLKEYLDLHYKSDDVIKIKMRLIHAVNEHITHKDFLDRTKGLTEELDEIRRAADKLEKITAQNYGAIVYMKTAAIESDWSQKRADSVSQDVQAIARIKDLSGEAYKYVKRLKVEYPNFPINFDSSRKLFLWRILETWYLLGFEKKLWVRKVKDGKVRASPLIELALKSLTLISDPNNRMESPDAVKKELQRLEEQKNSVPAFKLYADQPLIPERTQ